MSAPHDPPHNSQALHEDDFGVEEGAGYAGGDCDEVTLAGEDFDLGGAGNVGEVDGTSTADAGYGGFVGGDGGELGEEFAGVDEEGFKVWFDCAEFG